MIFRCARLSLAHVRPAHEAVFRQGLLLAGYPDEACRDTSAIIVAQKPAKWSRALKLVLVGFLRDGFHQRQTLGDDSGEEI
ncbi:hypothetical protein D3C87_1503520 [compost metagenome]